MTASEARTLRLLEVHNHVIHQAVTEYQGHVIKAVGDAFLEIEKKLSLGTVVSPGRPKLRNIAQRRPVYALLLEKPKGFRQTLQVLRLRTRRVDTAHRMVVAVVVGLLIGGGLVTLWSPSLSSFRNPQSPIANPEALPSPDKPSIAVL